jgi:RimJ/RimL family protein N-acetyltransferase
MNPYFPSELPVPQGITTPHLLLEPLKPDHVQLDYEAVMESRDYLRLWSGSSWPADDFTLEENLQDLRWHWREHRERAAFTFTVLDPSRETCLGCIYLRPLSELIPNNKQALKNVAADESLLRFWIRQSSQIGDLEQDLLNSLVSWLSTDWVFSRIFFETREENEAQKELFDAYLRPAMSLDMPQRGGRHLFYLATDRKR